MTDILRPEELETVRAFLEAHSTLALATVDSNGRPQVAPLFYWSDRDLNLFWLSSESSRHSLNIARNGKAATTIYPEVWQWTEIRGLQVEGNATLVGDVSWRESVLAAYRAKFQLPADLEAQIAASALYVLKPVWVRWLDNGVRFGYKAEKGWESG